MASASHRQTLLKRNNTAQIMLGVRKYGPISRAQLARSTGLSMTCVCSIVNELVSDGVLVETGTATGQRGGPMVLLSINPEGPSAAGVWFSFEEIDTIISNPAAEIVARRNIRFDYANSEPEVFINTIKGEVEKCAEMAGKDPASLQGIGLSVAAMIDPWLGVIITLIDGYDKLDAVPVARLLSDATGLPTCIDNDVRAGSYADACLGGGVKSGGTLYVIVGKGIGCAFIHNNDVLRGAHDVSCQFRNMIIDFKAPSKDGLHAGTMESLITDPAFIGTIWPELASASKTMPADESTDLVRRGLELAMQGDERAYMALTSVTKCMGIGIANMINIFDPHAVCVGGTLIDLASDFTLDAMRAETLRYVNSRAKGVEIRPIANYKEFVLQGAVGLVLGQQYRVLQEDNMKARMVTKLK